MAIVEQDIVFTTKDAAGNTVIQMPITRAENIENVMSIEQGGTGATTVATARNALGLGNTSGAVPIANGGTGATTVAAARNALGLGNTSGAVPIANGGTGATTAASARTNLGLSTAVTAASISGKTITLTKADGTTTTLTTQDTDTSYWTLSKSTSGYTRDKTTGFTMVWGTVESLSKDTTTTITFPKSFTNVYGVVIGSNSNGSSYDWCCEVAGTVSTTNFQMRSGGTVRKNSYYLAYGYCSS